MTKSEQNVEKQRYDVAIRFMASLLNEWTTPFGCYYECNRTFHKLLAESLPRTMSDIEAMAVSLKSGSFEPSQTYEAYGDLVVFCAMCGDSLRTDMGTQRGEKSEFHEAMVTKVPEFLHDIVVIQKLHSHVIVCGSHMSGDGVLTCHPTCGITPNSVDRNFHDMIVNEQFVLRLLGLRMTLWSDLRKRLQEVFKT